MAALTSSCDASSPDAEAFRAEVKAACLAMAVDLENPSIEDDPLGSESYGIALMRGEVDPATYVVHLR